LIGVFVKDWETWERRRKQVPNGFMTIPGWNGEELYTRMTYISFKKTLEYINQLFSQTDIINCSEGGARIEGMEHLPFVEAMEKYNVKSYDVHSKLSALIEENYVVKSDTHEDFQKIYKQYQEDRQDLQSMQEVAEEALDRLRKIR